MLRSCSSRLCRISPVKRPLAPVTGTVSCKQGKHRTSLHTFPPCRAKVLTIDNMNPHLRAMEYAVRGPIVIQAGKIEEDLKAGVKMPFPDVIRANIGDCHATGQPPITFLRQVVALCTDPAMLMNDPRYPSDAKERAQRVLDSCGGRSIGAYSDSSGVLSVRQDIADYIQQRDGLPAFSDDIFLCTGASDGIKTIMKMLMTGDVGHGRAGVMIPIPQYPLYTATIAEYNAYPIKYYMNEEKNWGLDISELKRSVDEARPECKPRAIVIINPGNPTGSVLSRQNIEDVIKFAKDEGLFILADEVYQHNVYAEGSSFHSFKKVMTEMGGDYKNMELASFMSVSKGYMGECGFRGGYCEVINLDPEVKVQQLKSISAKLCSSVSGQAAMDVVVNPPRPGEPSYDLFIKEKNKVLNDLKVKAKMVTETFNSMERFSCNEVKGAMYAFPQIHMPESAVQAAKALGKPADVMYCENLLQETGVCVVPGSGFGQRPGTYHFRTTILPTVEQLADMLERFKVFHEGFLQKFK
ncbi:alanine aminotransferase 1-like [Ylistrum balloti]|uniref:alanine aminotransferase 1-like n=1 Tax=Ylistrum balloti TaxID=509963 RepID=UPI002905E375|nr:alanine aminotransferase 1-like [Ylistrum balloti]